MPKRNTFIWLALFTLLSMATTAARASTEPQAATIRIIANSQMIPDGQSIPVALGQSVQLTVQLVNPDNSVTDITSAAETSYCSLTPWNIALSATSGLVSATINPSFGLTLDQPNVNTGAVAIEYLGGGNVSTPSRTVLFSIGSGTVTVPSALTITSFSTSQVSLSWTAASGSLQSYQVERGPSVNGPFTSLGTPTATSFSDTTVATNNAYIYRVRAVDTSNATSTPSNMVLATVWNYTDPSIVVGTTTIQAAHINDLRNATNAARAAVGLSAYSWHDTVSLGFLIKAQHITELRSAVNTALAVLSISTPSYTDPDPTLTVGTPIRAAHITDLRNALK